MAEIRWKPNLQFIKDPDDIVDYPFDFSEWLGDAIIVQAQALADNMTAAIESSTDTVAVLRVSEGPEGEKGSATVRITDSTGRQTDRSLFFRFKHQ